MFRFNHVETGKVFPKQLAQSCKHIVVDISMKNRLRLNNKKRGGGGRKNVMKLSVDESHVCSVLYKDPN